MPVELSCSRRSPVGRPAFFDKRGGVFQSRRENRAAWRCRMEQTNWHKERYPMATIQIEPESSLDSNSASFYKDCLLWAQKLQNAVGGGMSVKFFGRLYNRPNASFCWKGRHVARLFFNRQDGSIDALIGSEVIAKSADHISCRSVWHVVFRPGILEAVSKEEKRLADTRKRVNEVRWSDIPAEAAI